MLSREALALFRQRIERHGDIEVDDASSMAGRTVARGEVENAISKAAILI